MIEKALDAASDRSEITSPQFEAWRKRPSGYPRFSERIAVKPETGIYRRFDALNARRILFLQAELCVLELAIREVEARDNADKTGKKSQYATDYYRMLKAPVNQQREQLELVTKMNGKLDQYRYSSDQAVLQVSRLHELRSPDRFDLSDVQTFLRSNEMGPPYLDGEDRDLWGRPDDVNNYAPDLVGVHPRIKEDTFSRLVSERAIYLFKCGLGMFTKGNQHVGRYIYYDSVVLRATSWITCILASLLPIASIIVLTHLSNLNTKLWVIAVFNVFTSVCLRTLTDAKRAEIFAVTAA
ncbi:uncharacterized protein J4E79_002447 [Alternaria viburni]|uniref:uncharacterized protein n=1 Tax=Alternaria viburni TaxID=566460 RepID=UPI0020C53686|nr:uncharacterized protein J4E79_002447 [Alternaria viburni]KAI4666409.1 hypothetical protein J4E79_002447 [Alternaria viburni]